MRIVVKVGTSTLAYATGHINIRHMEQLCKVLSDLKNAGHEVVLVSSGAIGMGMGKLNMKQRPKALPEKQAAAAVGQCELMYTYDKLFGEYNHTVGQVLFTRQDIENKNQRENFINTMEKLLSMSVLPVINENDTVATEEIDFSDNDTLAAVVAQHIHAQLLVLLSDIDGLYSADPRLHPEAELIHEVTEITPQLRMLASDSVSGLGTGGMKTKLSAAETVLATGCDMVIANGADPAVLYDILDGKPVGTRFRSNV